MKRVRNVLGIFIVAGMLLVSAQAASAETIVVNGGNITVQATVAKTHYILIDAAGTITEITSNTKEDAKPRVYFQKVALGNERPMNDEVYRQYQAIIPTGKTDSVGTVYKQSEIARLPLFSTSNSKVDTALLSFLKR